MEYTITTEQRMAVLRERIAGAEADHFRKSLDQAQAEAVGDVELAARFATELELIEAQIEALRAYAVDD